MYTHGTHMVFLVVLVVFALLLYASIGSETFYTLDDVYRQTTPFQYKIPHIYDVYNTRGILAMPFAMMYLDDDILVKAIDRR